MLQQSPDFPPDHIPELWLKVPRALQPGMLAYIMDHRATGGFLQAIFENDLMLACSRADKTNRYWIPDIAAYIYNCAPAPCWGSVENVKRWLEERPNDGA